MVDPPFFSILKSPRWGCDTQRMPITVGGLGTGVPSRYLPLADTGIVLVKRIDTDLLSNSAQTRVRGTAFVEFVVALAGAAR